MSYSNLIPQPRSLMREMNIWYNLKRKDELTYCKRCGKKIWKFWYSDKLYSKVLLVILIENENKRNYSS